MHPVNRQSPALYEIVIQGELDPSWQQWFNSLTIMPSSAKGQSPTTTLVSPVADQAALRGMLCKLWDLNLTLLSIRRIEADGKKEEDND